MNRSDARQFQGVVSWLASRLQCAGVNVLSVMLC